QACRSLSRACSPRDAACRTYAPWSVPPIANSSRVRSDAGSFLDQPLLLRLQQPRGALVLRLQPVERISRLGHGAGAAKGLDPVAQLGHPPRAELHGRALEPVGDREELLHVALEPRLPHLLQPLWGRLQEEVDDLHHERSPPLLLEHAQTMLGGQSRRAGGRRPPLAPPRAPPAQRGAERLPP